MSSEEEVDIEGDLDTEERREGKQFYNGYAFALSGLMVQMQDSRRLSSLKKRLISLCERQKVTFELLCWGRDLPKDPTWQQVKDDPILSKLDFLIPGSETTAPLKVDKNGNIIENDAPAPPTAANGDVDLSDILDDLDDDRDGWLKALSDKQRPDQFDALSEEPTGYLYDSKPEQDYLTFEQVKEDWQKKPFGEWRKAARDLQKQNLITKATERKLITYATDKMREHRNLQDYIGRQEVRNEPSHRFAADPAKTVSVIIEPNQDGFLQSALQNPHLQEAVTKILQDQRQRLK